MKVNFDFTKKHKGFIGKRISTLTQYEQALVHLRFWEGYCLDEIAYLMKMSMRTTEEIQRSALKKLKFDFEKTFPELFEDTEEVMEVA